MVCFVTLPCTRTMKRVHWLHSEDKRGNLHSEMTSEHLQLHIRKYSFTLVPWMDEALSWLSNFDTVIYTMVFADLTIRQRISGFKTRRKIGLIMQSLNTCFIDFFFQGVLIFQWLDSLSDKAMNTYYSSSFPPIGIHGACWDCRCFVPTPELWSDMQWEYEGAAQCHRSLGGANVPVWDHCSGWGGWMDRTSPFLTSSESWFT